MVYTNHELTAQLAAAEERMAQFESQLAAITTALAVALEALERPQSAAKVRRLVK